MITSTRGVRNPGIEVNIRYISTRCINLVSSSIIVSNLYLYVTCTTQLTVASFLLDLT